MFLGKFDNCQMLIWGIFLPSDSSPFLRFFGVFWHYWPTQGGHLYLLCVLWQVLRKYLQLPLICTWAPVSKNEELTREVGSIDMMVIHWLKTLNSIRCCNRKQRQLEKTDLNNLNFREIIHVYLLKSLNSLHFSLFCFWWGKHSTRDPGYSWKNPTKKHRWKRNQPKRSGPFARSWLVSLKKIGWFLVPFQETNNRTEPSETQSWPNLDIATKVLPWWHLPATSRQQYHHNGTWFELPFPCENVEIRLLEGEIFTDFFCGGGQEVAMFDVYLNSKYEHTSQGKVAQFTR